MTRQGANLRGALVIVGTMLAAALGDDYFSKALPPIVMHTLGIVAVGVGAWRLFVDQSLTDSKATAADIAAQIQSGIEAHLASIRGVTTASVTPPAPVTPAVLEAPQSQDNHDIAGI
jgi:hypothetical protein